MHWNPLTGEDVAIAAHGYEAAVSSVGASLRMLRLDGRDLVASFPVDRVRPVFRGATLMPWPNRIRDGRYAVGGAVHQVPLNEPERGNALHGLVAWADWVVAEVAADRVALTTEIVPSDGYPFRLSCRAEHVVGAGGLTVSLTARNRSADAAPYGVSAHPYLTPGTGAMDRWTLTVPATEVLEVDPERMLPTGTVPLGRSPGLDFRGSRGIGDARIDNAYTGLLPEGDGTAEVRLEAADGSAVRMRWSAAALPWVQVHTADRPEPELNRAGLAVEPMTCPPDAFNSGTDLVMLEPGATHTATFTISG